MHIGSPCQLKTSMAVSVKAGRLCTMLGSMAPSIVRITIQQYAKNLFGAYNVQRRMYRATSFRAASVSIAYSKCIIDI
jgi:hypothetical protein